MADAVRRYNALHNDSAPPFASQLDILRKVMPHATDGGIKSLYYSWSHGQKLSELEKYLPAILSILRCTRKDIGL